MPATYFTSSVAGRANVRRRRWLATGDDGREKKAMVIPVFSLNKSPTFWFCSFACMLPVCRESLDDDDDDRLAALQCSAATSMAEPPQQHRLQRAIMYELRLCFFVVCIIIDCHLPTHTLSDSPSRGMAPPPPVAPTHSYRYYMISKR